MYRCRPKHDTQFMGLYTAIRSHKSAGDKRTAPNQFSYQIFIAMSNTYTQQQ